jgi:hypothetical protein
MVCSSVATNGGRNDTRRNMELGHFSTITQTHRNPRTTTDKYRLVPTTEALEVLARHGWHPVRAQQAGVRKPENEGYQQHAVWLECPLLTERLRVGDRVVPRVLLRNSHQGDASFRLFPALLEKVCSNGLIVSRPGGDYRIRHVGFAAWKVAAAIDAIAQNAPKTLDTRHRWEGLSLGVGRQLRFAHQAAALRWHPAVAVEAWELLQFRPGQDDGSLWSVFNAVQEALLRGGVPFRRPDGSQGLSRPVRGIDDVVSINQRLWRLAEQTAGEMN